MNDLENISYSKVVNTDSVCYTEWRKGLKPIYTMVWRDILSGYFAIILLIILNIITAYYFPSLIIPAAFFASVMIGFVLAYLALFIHEAGHFNLHHVKKRSDLLATFFLCSFFGIDIKSYRKIHWEHHLHLGTTSDTENSYFNALTSSFLLESLTGIYMLKVIANKNAN